MGGILNKKLKDKIKFDDIILNLDLISTPNYDSLMIAFYRLFRRRHNLYK